MLMAVRHVYFSFRNSTCLFTIFIISNLQGISMFIHSSPAIRNAYNFHNMFLVSVQNSEPVYPSETLGTYSLHTNSAS
jgi:hypothetical protein